MTGPSKTTTPKTPDSGAPDQGDSSSSPTASAAVPAADAADLADLARSQDDVARRARRLVAGELPGTSSNGSQSGERLLDSARAGLLAELREQEQEQGRRRLEHAARSSEDAVAGVVHGVTAVIRSFVPAVLARPEDVLEAAFALADQGLRIGRRCALTVTSSIRSLSQAA